MRQFLEEPGGGLSSLRLVFMVWSLGVFGIWAYASVRSGTLQPIDNSITVMYGAVLSAKVIQRYGERETDATATDGNRDH